MAGLANSYFWNARWTFKANHSKEKLIKFIIVNIVALSINLITLKITVDIYHINELISQVIAIFFALIFNFLGNNLWTFKERIKK